MSMNSCPVLLYTSLGTRGSPAAHFRETLEPAKTGNKRQRGENMREMRAGEKPLALIQGTPIQLITEIPGKNSLKKSLDKPKSRTASCINALNNQ